MSKGYEFKDILASYGGAAESMKAQRRQTGHLVLSCQWSEYSALDDPREDAQGKNAMILEVPCFKGMDPVQVVSALGTGLRRRHGGHLFGQGLQAPAGQGHLGKAAGGPAWPI